MLVRLQANIIWFACIGLLVTAPIVCRRATAQAKSPMRYEPPAPPTLLPPNAPSFRTLDVEVDKFVRVAEARRQFEVTGKGLAVVVIDTGVNPYHLSFQGKLLPGRNFTTIGAEDDITDIEGHGSNVAGIIAAATLPSSESMPDGVAPDAMIVPLKVFPGGEFDTINRALQWILAYRDEYLVTHKVLISVVNMSLGAATNLHELAEGTIAELDHQRALIKKLRELGVVVTVSAGNQYAPQCSVEGMDIPAIFPETLSVGAVFDVTLDSPVPERALAQYKTGATVFAAREGRIVAFSQRLSGETGGEFRTDIFAPGFFVTSMGPVPPSNSGQDPKTTLSTQDGTSQASPVAAGVVLLLQQRYRFLLTKPDRTGQAKADEDLLPSVDFIEECLRVGGHAIVDTEDAVGRAMDNVTSCGKSFMYLDAVGALAHLEAKIGTNLRMLEIELYKAPTTQREVLEQFDTHGASRAR